MGSTTRLLYVALNLLTIALLSTHGAQISITPDDARLELDVSRKQKLEPKIQIKCRNDSMLIIIENAPPNHETGLFSGMIYPKDLSGNSSCLTEYRDHDGPLQYKLPLRKCNTMPKETDDGKIEFFNAIILQPHLKLITDSGRGYRVSCTYKSRDVTMKKKLYKTHMPYKKSVQRPQAYRSNEHQAQNQATDRRDYARSLDKIDELDAEVDVSNGDDDAGNELPMPGCHLKIYNDEHKIASDVHIGDPLTIVVSIDPQKLYGLHVTDCVVRDGIGFNEQRLVGEDGCPMDNEIMGQFKYAEDRLAANVTFPAHKFPNTASVYYQCNVRLCGMQNPECKMAPVCSGKRPKRQTISDIKDEEGQPATIEVFSGLYVNENDNGAGDDDDADSVLKEKAAGENFCFSQRAVAIYAAIAGLVLMLLAVTALLCLLARCNTKTVSNSGSSIYSGPYTNTAFSHSS